jgi:hypothetical protein
MPSLAIVNDTDLRQIRDVEAPRQISDAPPRSIWRSPEATGPNMPNALADWARIGFVGIRALGGFQKLRDVNGGEVDRK